MENLDSSLSNIIILKIGGSILTDKSAPLKVRYDNVSRIANEIAGALKIIDDINLIVIHGGGSFGHYIAGKYLSGDGHLTPKGVSEIALWMQKLNLIFIEKLYLYGLNALSFSPHSICRVDGNEYMIHIDTLIDVLDRGIVPVMYGDVVVDSSKGFKIVSGDILAWKIAMLLKARYVLFATNVDGVFDKDPRLGGKLLREIRIRDLDHRIRLSKSRYIDVTGGMKIKVLSGIDALKSGIKGHIFNGDVKGNIYRSLIGDRSFGTVIAG